MRGRSFSGGISKDWGSLARPVRNGSDVLALARSFLEARSASRLVNRVHFFCNRFRVGRTHGRTLHRRFWTISRIGPALIEAPFIALAGALGAIAYARMRPAYAPLAAAAAFTICEWLRSIGVLAAPFDQLGYTQADTPLRASPPTREPTASRSSCARSGVRRGLAASPNLAPSARSARGDGHSHPGAGRSGRRACLPPPTIPVVAVQGNIPQSFKWNSLGLAVRRYTAMTLASLTYIRDWSFGRRRRSRRRSTSTRICSASFQTSHAGLAARSSPAASIQRPPSL